MTSDSEQSFAMLQSVGSTPSDPFEIVEQLGQCLVELDALSKLIHGRTDGHADAAAKQLLRIAGSIARKGVDNAIAFGHLAVHSVAAELPAATQPRGLGFAMSGIVSRAEALKATIAIGREHARAKVVTAANALACMQEIRCHIDALHGRIAEAAGTYWSIEPSDPAIGKTISPETRQVHIIAMSALLSRIDPGRVATDHARSSVALQSALGVSATS